MPANHLPFLARPLLVCMPTVYSVQSEALLPAKLAHASPCSQQPPLPVRTACRSYPNAGLAATDYQGNNWLPQIIKYLKPALGLPSPKEAH